MYVFSFAFVRDVYRAYIKYGFFLRSRLNSMRDSQCMRLTYYYHTANPRKHFLTDQKFVILTERAFNELRIKANAYYQTIDNEDRM